MGTKIKFDQAAASALIKASDDAKKTLEDQQQSRGTSAQNAAEKFSGPYADLFARVRETETADRGKIVGALQALSKGVHDVAVRAQQEQQRLDDYSAWLKRQRNKKAEDFTLEDRINDPEPERMPYYPPKFDAKFSATTRERKISLDVASKEVSANPEALKAFVTYRAGSDAVLEGKFKDLKAAISDYADKCAWSGAAGIQVFPGIDTYIEENTKDRTWISGIADAFRKAGSGTTSALAICVSLGESDPEHTINLFNYPDMDPGRIYILAKEIANIPGSEDALADLAQQWLDKAQKTQNAEDIARAAALIDGISTNPKASAETLRKIGASGLVEGIKLAILNAAKKAGQDLYPIGQKKEIDSAIAANLGLATALKSLLSNGEQEIARQNPEESRQLARDIINTIHTSTSMRTGETPSPDHQYIVAYLLQDNKLSTPFLGVAGKILEQTEKGFKETGDSWEKRKDLFTGEGNPYNPGALLLTLTNNPGSGHDPMAAYMSALGNNSEASLRFFTGAGADHPEERLSSDEALSRQKYWIEERNWNRDSYTGLSAALRSATTNPENVGSTEALQLASNAIHFLGKRTGENALDKNSLSPKASVDLGIIISTHMPSVDIAITREDGSTASHVNDLTGAGKKRKDLIEILGDDSVPRFSITDLTTVTRAIIASPEGLSTLREGLNTYQDIRTSKIIENHRNDQNFKNLLEQALLADAEIEGWFDKQIKDTTMDNAVEQNERVKAWANGASTSVQNITSIASLAPVPGGPVVSTIASQVANNTVASAADHYTKSVSIDLKELGKEQQNKSYNNRDSLLHRTLAILDDYGIITEEEIRKEASSSVNNTADVEKWIKLGTYPNLEMLMSESGWDELSLSIAENYINDMKAFNEAYNKHN